jgi:tripartite-type tricarboxylate transporter receptor subunit TctC
VFALVAPAGTAREIVLRLNAEVTRVVAQPDTQKRFADLGMTIGPGSPDMLDAYIKSEIGKWSQVIKEADVHSAE